MRQRKPIFKILMWKQEGENIRAYDDPYNAIYRSLETLKQNTNFPFVLVEKIGGRYFPKACSITKP